MMHDTLGIGALSGSLKATNQTTKQKDQDFASQTAKTIMVMQVLGRFAILIPCISIFTVLYEGIIYNLERHKISSHYFPHIHGVYLCIHLQTHRVTGYYTEELL